MMSFYVESLFTNVPIDVALEVARQKLENDPSQANRTSLTPSQILRPPNLRFQIYVLPLLRLFFFRHKYPFLNLDNQCPIINFGH